MTRPLLLLIRGLPGSGKSSISGQLVSMLPGVDVTLLDPDAVDVQSVEYLAALRRFTAIGVPPEIHVYRYLCDRTRRAVERNGLVIWNQPFTNRTIFRALLRVTESFPHPPNILIVELEIDPVVAFERVRRRMTAGGHGIPWRRFEQYVIAYESFADLGLPTIRIQSEEWPHLALLRLAESIRATIGIVAATSRPGRQSREDARQILPQFLSAGCVTSDVP